MDTKRFNIKSLPLYRKIKANYELLNTRTINISDIYNTISLCAELTSEYDESHDMNHHIDVFVHTINIYLQLRATIENIEIILPHILYAALLHDTIDYKYPKDLEYKQKKVDKFLKNNMGDKWLDVKWIIDNMSYSKEVKNGYPLHSDKMVQLARDIVSDADKLEAIGDIGIIRATQYGKVLRPHASEEEIRKLVVQHCYDKLLKIKDQYIRTAPAKQMAVPCHQILVDFINKYGN